jgi:toxin ParE1/3/4
MRFYVLLTEDASRDLEDICAYVAERDASGKSDALFSRPIRTEVPIQEFSALGIREYRQVFHKPYRLIYSISGTSLHLPDRGRPPRFSYTVSTAIAQLVTDGHVRFGFVI